MQYGNLRAILHQGVDVYLTWLVDDPTAEEQLRLLADLDGPLDRDEAVQHLSTIFEAVVDDYVEYMDYNSTTTQSDRGDMLYTLLDFLRLLASYDRVAWNLQPIVLAHEVLVRRGRIDAAGIWREALSQRTAEIADSHLERFQQLGRQYGMRLPSVAERLGERFVRPLVVDRLRALVGPAIDELRAGSPTGSFELLEAGIDRLTEEPTGVGFDVPNWLEALEQEVDAVRADASEPVELASDIPQIVPPLNQLREQVERWSDSE